LVAERVLGGEIELKVRSRKCNSSQGEC
jgi:hypothetical protein